MISADSRTPFARMLSGNAFRRLLKALPDNIRANVLKGISEEKWLNTDVDRYTYNNVSVG